MESQKVMTVLLDKVNIDVLKRRSIKLGLPGDGSKKTLVARYAERMKELMKSGEVSPDDRGQCDVCRGYSNLGESSECPYCGTIDEELDEDVTSESQNSSNNKSKSAKKLPTKPTKKSVTAASKARRKRKSGPKPKSAKKPREPKSVETSNDESTEQSENPSDIVDVSSKAGTDLVVYTESDLDSSLDRLNVARTDATKGIYAYAQELKRIHDLELWKLRVNGKYPNFGAFCQTEVRISRQYAYKLFSIIEAYSQEQFEKHGLYKCNLALQVPAEVRSAVLGSEKGTESRESVSQRARELMGKESDARKTPPPSDRAEAVTVAVVPGLVEVEMQKRPLVDDWPAGKLTEPATSITDDPWFRMGLTNNVFMSVRLTRNNRGHIMAIVEFRRGEETA